MKVRACTPSRHTAIYIITSCSLIQFPPLSVSVSLSLATHPTATSRHRLPPNKQEHNAATVYHHKWRGCPSPLSSLCTETVSNLTMPLAAIDTGCLMPLAIGSLATRSLGLSWLTVSRARFAHCDAAFTVLPLQCRCYLAASLPRSAVMSRSMGRCQFLVQSDLP